MIMIILVLLGCVSAPRLRMPDEVQAGKAGSELYRSLYSADWRSRDSIIVKEFLAGNRPAFLNKLVPVSVPVQTEKGQKGDLVFYVTADYLSIGRSDDWARVPMTPMAAQQIADSLHCILPTPKMTDLIWSQAKVKLDPMPLLAYRDSGWIFWQHHLIIEGQRKGRKGLIAGIKKDVVNSGRLLQQSRPNRVAIYGWHQLSGKPIQPVYAGHVNWYVDYSHGVRLVYDRFRWKGKWLSLDELEKYDFLSSVISDSIDNIKLKYRY